MSNELQAQCTPGKKHHWIQGEHYVPTLQPNTYIFFQRILINTLNQVLNGSHFLRLWTSMSTFSLQLRDAILRRQWPEICCSSVPAAATPKLEEGNVSNAKSKRGTGAIGAASAWLISMGHGWFSRAERSWHRGLAMHAQLDQGEELIIWVRGKKCFLLPHCVSLCVLLLYCFRNKHSVSIFRANVPTLSSPTQSFYMTNLQVELSW